MKNRMSLESNMNKSIIGSSNNAYDEHKPLGVVHDKAPQIHAPSLNVGSSSVRVTHRGVPSLIRMYILGSIFLNRDLTTTCKFFFFSCTIRK